MNKVQITIIIISLVLCTLILLYPPVIEYTDKGDSPEQIRRLLFYPRTYKKTLVHYKTKDGKKFDVVINESDIKFEKEVQQMENEGSIVKLAEAEIVHANVKYDFTKMLLELVSVTLPTFGLLFVFKSKKQSQPST